MPPAAPLQIVSRLAAAVFGGWAFALGSVSAGVLLLMQTGMAYSNAQTLMYLLGALVLLSAFLWAFSAANAGRVWAVLGGGGLAMTGAAWWLARATA